MVVLTGVVVGYLCLGIGGDGCGSGGGRRMGYFC